MWGRGRPEGGGGGDPKWNRGNRKRSQEAYRKKVFFFLFKRKGQKAKIRKNTLGDKQTKGKRTSNSHDHIFKAVYQSRLFFFLAPKSQIRKKIKIKIKIKLEN
jgi:hypothetical protein